MHQQKTQKIQIEKVMMKLLKNSKVVILLDQAIFSGTSFILTILLAQILSMENFGQFAMFILGIHLLVSGIGAFIIQPFQVLFAKENNHQQYTTFVFWFQILAITCVALLSFCIHLIFPSLFPIFLIAYGTGFLIHDFGRRLLLVLNKPMATLLFDGVSALLSLIAIYLFSSLSVQNLDSLFAVLSFSYLSSFILLINIIRPSMLTQSFVFQGLLKHWREGKWYFFTVISQWWASNLFVVASGIYLGTAALGALRLAQSLMGVLNILLQTFENYILPLTAKKLNDHPEEGLNYVVGISRKAGLLFIPVLVVVFLFAEPLIVLAGGSEYASYAFTLKGMTILYFIIFLSQPIRLFIRAMLLNNHFFYGYLISLSFSLIFAHTLLSSYGLMGAILGLSISQILLITYWTIILQKKKIHLWKSFISF
ncbi:lipopolysaccharide biosynthesis protein [Brumimicrobium aurantiacum]|uniref:Polysaccharide biosynthesis protein C-terminal domain-containing protein n=1 Tax=Brumimicrobium aurantiacum TaxID=1737063 RepID=A0A3E1EZY8_9FLAO|nr:oligosaccharide flippase family protein [Brumimicrobium aurantiacum]RFC55043.1 hypothetical protein DXU93_04275 [Brumimicrobium aurantiacum]